MEWFFINLTWICPALWEFTRPLALDLRSQTVPSRLSSGGFSCLLIALFSYFSPKSFLPFFFLFTFKPSQALLSLWFLLTAFERFKMLFFFSYSCGRWPRRQGCWFECPFSSQRQNQDPGWGSWFFCEATLSTDAFVSDLAGDRVLSAALWVSTCPTEPLPTGDRCFLYPPGWPAFM